MAESELPEPQDPAGDSSAAPATQPSAPEAPRPVTAGPRTIGFDPSVAERRQRAEEHWERVVAARENGEIFTGLISGTVKGGLLVDIGGVAGFLPASQAHVPDGQSLDALVKTKASLRIIEVDAKRRRVVVSHRRALDDERRRKRAELLRSLAVGQRHEGVVVRLAPFGAFVDIGSGIEGMIPISELALERVENVSDVVTVGDRVPVSILRVEEGGKKIGLSRRNAMPDPWRDHASVVRPGAVVTGTVVAKEPRLVVEIAPGVTGTVREGDADPAQYEIGETVEVAVRTVDRRNRRIGLSTANAAAAAMPQRTGFAPLGEELLAKKPSR